MIEYFKNIYRSATTIFEGLTITASHLLRKPITTQYPDRTKKPVIEMLPERYRGFLNCDPKICTACTLCEQSCPINCISIGIDKKQVANPVEGKPPLTVRMISSFDIDIGLCMFCGLCVEACPTGAIHFTKEFERAVPSLGELVFRFVKGAPVEPYKPVKGK